jgi:hypothetical protein
MASPSYPGSRSIKSPYPRFEFGISSLSDGWSMDIKIFFGIVVVVVEVVTVVDGEEGVVLVIDVSTIVSSTALSVSIEHAIKKSMKIKDLFIILKIKNY